MALEHANDTFLAGGLLRGPEFSPIYVRPDTGDVLYEEEESGAIMLIEGLTETNPIELPRSDDVELALRTMGYGPGVLGIVYTHTHAVLILSETVAERRPFDKLFTAGHTIIEIDLNTMDPLSEEDEQ